MTMQLLDNKVRHFKTRGEIRFPFPAPACYHSVKMNGGSCFHNRQCCYGYLKLCDVAYVPPKPGFNTRVVNSIRTCKGEN